MSSVWQNKTVRALLLRRSFEGLLLIVLIVAAVYGYRLVREIRLEVLAREHALEMEPVSLLNLSTVRGDLRAREHDVGRIAALIIRQEEVGDFISHLEQMAERHRVIIQVPEVGEEVVLNEQGRPIEPTGPHLEIHLEVLVLGEPERLVSFLHELEHVQYLAYVPEWRLEAGAQRPSGFERLANEVPASEGQPAAAAGRTGILDATILLTVHNEKYSAQ